MIINNQAINIPISVSDPYELMGVGIQPDGYNLGYVNSNQHKKINPWSKYKPLRLSNPSAIITEGNVYRGDDKNCGLVIPIETGIKEAAEQGAFTLAAPRGGSSEVFRLTDWNGYNKGARPFLHLEDEADKTYEVNLAQEDFLYINVIYEPNSQGGFDRKDLAIFEDDSAYPYFWSYEIYSEYPTTGELFFEKNNIDSYSIFSPQGNTPGIIHTYMIHFEKEYWDWHGDIRHVYLGMYNKGNKNSLPLPSTKGLPGIPQWDYKIKVKLKEEESILGSFNPYYIMGFDSEGIELLSMLYFNGTEEAEGYFEIYTNSIIIIAFLIDNKKGTSPIYPKKVTFKMTTSMGLEDCPVTHQQGQEVINPGEEGAAIYSTTAKDMNYGPSLGGAYRHTRRIYQNNILVGKFTVDVRRIMK